MRGLLCRLAIACCLVFVGEHNAQAATALVRQHRPGSLQTHQQEHFVATFETYLAHLRCLPTLCSHACRPSILNACTVCMLCFATQAFLSQNVHDVVQDVSLLLAGSPCTKYKQTLDLEMAHVQLLHDLLTTRPIHASLNHANLLTYSKALSMVSHMAVGTWHN